MYGVAWMTVIGELADDPRVRTVGEKQTKLATFRVKCTKPKRRPEDKYGPTAWIDCQAWGYVADMIEAGRKGDPVHLVGDMETQSWEADGVKKYKLVCTASTIYTPRSSRLADGPPKQQQQQKTQSRPRDEPSGSELYGDDLPF